MLLIILLTISAVTSLPVRESICHPEDEFTCKNGTCIPIEWVCDNVPDCSKGEDEVQCDYLHVCAKDFLMCRSGECLPKEVKCNGHSDCSNNSDELGCKQMESRTQLKSRSLPSNVSRASSSLSLCHSEDEFACNNGTCIPVEWMCDNVPDCRDGEDEVGCDYVHVCQKESLMCRSGECLPKEVKCNGHPDCMDRSDEFGCTQTESSSHGLHSSSPPLCHSDNEFACNNGTCIPIEWMCDNVPDCQDKEDEVGCDYVHTCQKESLMCRSGECLSKEVKCNGHSDCLDSSDELGCLKDNTTDSTVLSTPSAIEEEESCSFWIYLTYSVLALTAIALVCYGLYHLFVSRRRFSGEANVSFLAKEDDEDRNKHIHIDNPLFT